MVENIFWLVRGTEIVYRPELMVYNKKHKKIKYFYQNINTNMMVDCFGIVIMDMFV